MTRQEIQINIERYIAGDLSGSEINQLWEEFIKDPYHLDYLITYVSLRELTRNTSLLPKK